MNIYASFSFIPLMASEKKIFEYFFFKNLAFRLPWQPIKISDLDKDYSSKISVKLFSKHLQ